MRGTICGLLWGVVTIGMLAPGCAWTPEEPGERAPLFDDLGSHHHPITTASPDAQRYFDQGLTLAFGFNHAEAERSFRYAAQLDPACAMCWWGVAFVLGPNINAPMEPAAATPAWEAIGKARALAPAATPAEQAYIAALAKRYAPQPPADRAPLDQAFASAAGAVSRKYPDDLDAAALYAEALMDLHPWDYYDRAGKPKRESTRTLTSTLASVLRKNPDHAWAIHLFIHATEASAAPGRAEAYADRLADLVPGAGHLVHMPGHTYMRVGRYHDAVLANERAAAADDSYLSQCQAQGVYPIGYVPHNHHFLWAAAAMEGNSAAALRSAASTHDRAFRPLLHDPAYGGFIQHFTVTPVFALVRFGQWTRILELEEPPAELVYPRGLRHYARGRANAALGRPEDAQRELDALRNLLANPAVAKAGNVSLYNSVESLLKIAEAVLAGELAAARRDWPAAVRHLEHGVKLEDALAYNEPPDWSYPVRHSLGAVLLAAGEARKAERVYREDLRRNPENGWSLFGLQTSLELQAKKGAAAEAAQRFEKAWQHADVTLTASRF